LFSISESDYLVFFGQQTRRLSDEYSTSLHKSFWFRKSSYVPVKEYLIAETTMMVFILLSGIEAAGIPDNNW
jgi:hypothetical protein